MHKNQSYIPFYTSVSFLCNREHLERPAVPIWIKMINAAVAAFRGQKFV